MHKGAKYAVGGVAAALVGAAGLGVWNIADAIGGDGGSAHTEAAPVETGPPSAREVESAARDFLAAWEAGDTEKAAGLTDNVQAATAALTGYREAARIEKVTFRQAAASGATVPFTVTAEVALGAQRSTWTYESSLAVVRGRGSGRPLVDWQPAVLHPQLAAGESLKTAATEAPQITAVDRDGKELDPKEYPSLAPLLPELRKRFGEKAGGEPGVEVRSQGAGGAPGKTLFVVSKGKPGTLRTTIDAGAQRAAEAAVARHADASVVSVRPSTGEILAIANAQKTGFNAAVGGTTAPGSTMKIVTSAALLEQGKAAPSKPLPCPKFATYGMQFHNVEKSENPGATFAQDFAASCNTAFISLAGQLSDTALADEARDVFGIGLDWKAGISTFDGKVPSDSGAGKAAAMIGQGRVQMNPLTMASVAATVRNGSFKQPYLVDPSVDGRELARAPRSLPSGVASDLRSMMRLTATAGTGATAMSGLGGDIGAKTGSAEVDGQTAPNGWFTAYRGDVAAAAVVPQGGHGGDSAGPIVAAVLRGAP
ncbi:MULTISPECIES: penicillin-binding transpeptidase domain-containing protein [Streptomyces]|uniref:Penicillin-binding protein n=1 Tax=Streptomyces morookaense TaxID=1970 RepID=A0A7Y7B571_STRMO|nr:MULTISPECIES: penicillin-binding transpeptidase domain-containing protein [Streptomyces]MCC2278420.1 penicillin-binding protein [Streptomyces sp. ET3-23]NVK79090.1 penicillin-binding protein [Streptomyces morookaense]GHF10254.1 penicillin-binding protein [Streptomyces morookaense]